MSMPAGLVVNVLYTMLILVTSPFLRTLDGAFTRAIRALIS